MADHQLDEISRAIGRVDAYVHEFRHGTSNLSSKMDGMELQNSKRHETLKIELTNQNERSTA